MTGLAGGRRFESRELLGADDFVSLAHLDSAVAVARRIETTVAGSTAVASLDLVERIMASVAREPAHRASGILATLARDPGPRGLVDSLRLAYARVATSSAPFSARAGALAYVAAVLVLGLTISGVAAFGAAGALGLLPRQSEAPLVSPLPSPVPLVSPEPTVEPSESDEASEAPEASPEPSESDDRASGTHAPEGSDDDGGVTGPASSDDHGGNSGPGSSDSHSGSGGDDGASATPSSSDAPEPTSTPSGGSDGSGSGSGGDGGSGGDAADPTYGPNQVDG